jgi:hypothetical protein
MLFSADELTSDFSELNILLLEEQKQFFETGIMHRGTAETIRLLAVRTYQMKRKT